MDKISLYIKRIITLLVLTAAYVWLQQYFAWYFVAPSLAIVLSLIVSRINQEVPTELFDYSKSNLFFQKGGLRELLKIFVYLFGFIYDVIVYAIWGVVHVFLIIVDVFYLLKIIGFWLVNAVIWSLKLYVPFWRLLFNNTIHYLIKWPWWIYRNSFRNIRLAYQKNVLRISLIGAAIALLLVQIFYFLEITVHISYLRYVGVVLALLPIVWAFGEISSLRAQKFLRAKWYSVQLNFDNGMESVRSLLFFIAIFVLLILVQISLNLLGWLSGPGISFASFTINLNALINTGIIILCVVIYFSVLIMPSYRLYNEFTETSVNNTWIFFKKSAVNVLHYIFFFIPASFFAALASIVPIVIMGVALWLTIGVKNNVVDVRINKVQEKLYASENVIGIKKYQLETDRLKEIKSLPFSIFNGVRQIKTKQGSLANINRQIEALPGKYFSKKDEIKLTIAELSQKQEHLQQRTMVNSGQLTNLQLALNENYLKEKALNQNFEDEKQLLLLEKHYAQSYIKQFPLVFYFITLLAVILCIPVFTIILGYFGNVLYDVFIFRKEVKVAYFTESIFKEQAIDKKQPLLSTTLNVITIVVLLTMLFIKGILF